MSKRLLAAGIILSLAACAGGRKGSWQGSVTDSAGVAIVSNPTTGSWGPGEAWTVKEELRIGTAEGDPDYQFGLILAAGSIAVTSDGRIVVFDAQGQHIKVFMPDGKYERTIGHAGAGPGEIGIAQQSSILVTPGDTILLNDFGNQRVNLYLLDGTFVRSFPLNLADGIPLRWETTADGRVVAQMRRLSFPGSTAPPDSMDAIMVIRLDGSTGDTLMRVPSGKTFSFTGGAPEWHFFVPEPLWALTASNGILYAVNDKYRIGIYERGGQLERIIEKPFALAPVTDADQATMKVALKKLVAAQAPGAPPQVVSQIVDTRMHFAPNYPAFAQMLAGPDGAILVQKVVPISNLSEEERKAFDFLSGNMGSRQWDVFDSEGRYLGALSMPVRYQPIQFIGDKIYGIQRDELDVQYVVRLGIVKGNAAAD